MHRVWLRHRRFGVPPTMIERATERRLAGDWRGACAAARIDVDIDAGAAAAFADDLRHLAPDLLRWHEPLHGHYSWPARTGPIPMTRLGDGRGIVLVQGAARGQGRRPLRLEIGRDLPPAPSPIDRRLWDVRRSPGLHTLCGPEPIAPGAACPHATGAQRAAAEAAGIDAAALREPRSRYSLAARPLVWDRLVPAARALLEQAGATGSVVDLGDGWLDLGRPRPTILDALPPQARRRAVPLLPGSRWEAPLDAELVRHGLIDAGALHPLVHAGLLPARTQVRRPYTPPVPALVPVACGGHTHRLAVGDGRCQTPDHDAAEPAREATLAALGGPVNGCAAALRWWHTGGHPPQPLPEAVLDLHDELWQRVWYGDTDGILRLLDEGYPPDTAASDAARGSTLMHALRWVDHARVLPRLLALGLDVNARTAGGATPLQEAMRPPGSDPGLVEALLRAGAEPPADPGP